MIKPARIFFITTSLLLWFLYAFATPISAQFYPEPSAPNATPEPCRSGGSPVGSYCPNLGAACKPNATKEEKELCVKEGKEYLNTCAVTYDEWLKDKSKNFWVQDPDVTALGKGGERSRQFLLWVLSHPSIDDHPVILDIWRLSRNVATFLILIVAILMGAGIIIGQRKNFNLRIEIPPLIVKLAVILLFVIFSARIVLVIVQLSDILMEFFIRQLGVRKLFNIFFVAGQDGKVIQESERAYREFLGCTNWNVNNVEMVRTSKFLVKFTNMTYYFLGIMLILRKVVLWFLLVISPFLAILAPFIFIRNIGWIWIGVFFQWVFYGPIFALFLGTLAKLWNSPVNIPYVFDFSRTHQMAEAVYPTSINILYGGPAQTLGIWNTSNYVDTFAEYIISLIMLWTVVVLPWWLLRIFRDYCCDGIASMKNILLSMYDTMRGGPGGPTPPQPSPRSRTTGLAREIPQKVETKVKIATTQDVKRANTNEIMRSMHISASNLADIARMETVKETRETVRRNIDYMQNPQKAHTASEKSKFMAVRSEIRSRAASGDRTAVGALSAIETSARQRQTQQARILSSMPHLVPVIHTIAVKFHLPKEKTRSIIQKIITSITQDTAAIERISQKSKLTTSQATQILSTISTPEILEKTTQDLVKETAVQSGVSEESVKAVISQTAIVAKQKKDVAQHVADEEQVEKEVVERVVQEHLPAVSEPEKHVEAQVATKVSLEEYEEVKSMWADQYERGDVPVSEEIPDRESWVEHDTISITNILNKLMSADERLRAQALDEVGYILPIFMVNEMSGEQLVTYLKAKVEAAKQVKEDLAQEKAEAPEEFVEVKRAKSREKAQEKVRHRALKMDVPETKKESNPAGRVSEESKDQSGNETEPVDEVKRKLEREINGDDNSK